VYNTNKLFERGKFVMEILRVENLTKIYGKGENYVKNTLLIMVYIKYMVN